MERGASSERQKKKTKQKKIDELAGGLERFIFPQGK
jgi:hypothetical protein